MSYINAAPMPRRSLRLASVRSNALGSDFAGPLSLPSEASDPDKSVTPDSGEDLEPFRLLDLAAELRNRIYGYIFADRPICDISHFSIPQILLTCRQVRHEALPIFFAETRFYVPVAGNFFTQGWKGLFGSPWPFTEQEQLEHEERIGTVETHPIISNSLKSSGKAVYFRHVTFEVFDSFIDESIFDILRSSRLTMGDSRAYRRPGVLLLHLRVMAGNLRLSTESQGDHLLNLAVEEKCEIDGAAERASRLAAEIAGEKMSFRGFKMRDLKKVAKVFRVGD